MTTDRKGCAHHRPLTATAEHRSSTLVADHRDPSPRDGKRTPDNVRRRIIFCLLVTVAASLSGCLQSKKPLFPAPGYTAGTPIKPGHYVESTTSVPDGRQRVLSAGKDGAVISQEGQRYVVQRRIASSEDVRLFNKAGSPGTFAAQISHSKEYVYRRVDAYQNGDGFNMWHQECKEIPPNQSQNLQRKGWMDDSCNFNTTAALDSVIRTEQYWSKSRIDVFNRVPEEDIIKLKDLKPEMLIDPFCSDSKTKSGLGPGFGKGPTPTGTHMKILSVSSPSDKGRYAVAMEANGDAPGKWAWIGGWKESEKKIACRPYYLIGVLALRPEKSVINEKDKNLVARLCPGHGFGYKCAPASEMIAAYQAQGHRIILQGLEYVFFPDRTVMPTGRVLTVMGQEGLSPRLLVLVTEKYGETTALYDLR